MSRKDFMRGVEATAKANEAFMRKQAAATEELGKRIVQKIDEQGQIIDVILDTLNAQEKKELYDLQSAYDIAELDKNEKEVLASYLLTLIANYRQDSDNQKEYYSAVKKHLEVTDVSPDFNLALVENVDSRTEAKAMFQTVCEFLFLKTGDFSFLDEFEDEIECFGLSSKAIKEAVAPIQRIYDILGLRGIVEHYIPADPEDEIVPEHYGLIAPLTGELIIDDSNRDISAGEEVVFEDLRIIFNKQLQANGKVLFKNCELIFNYEGVVPILALESTSELTFQDCEFKAPKKSTLSMISVTGKCIIKNCLFNDLDYRYGVHDDVLTDDGGAVDYNCAFIDIDGYSDGTAVFEMTHCHILGCEGTFVSADGNSFGDNFNICIDGCLIENHVGNFLMARFADQGNKTGVKILNSTFNNVKAYELAEDYDFRFNNFLSLIHVSSTAFSCENCTFTNVEEQVLAVDNTLGSMTPETICCKFDNCIQKAPLIGNIKNCEFENMQEINFGHCVEFNNKVVTVSECDFNQINGKITVEYGKIEHCTFRDSTLNVEVVGKPTGRDSYHSEANDLTFINCNTPKNEGYSFMDSPSFLQAKSYLDKDGICVLFNGCKFENCRKTGQNFINVDAKVYGAFDRLKTVTLGREIGTVIV